MNISLAKFSHLGLARNLAKKGNAQKKQQLWKVWVGLIITGLLCELVVNRYEWKHFASGTVVCSVLLDKLDS